MAIDLVTAAARRSEVQRDLTWECQGCEASGPLDDPGIGRAIDHALDTDHGITVHLTITVGQPGETAQCSRQSSSPPSATQQGSSPP